MRVESEPKSREWRLGSARVLSGCSRILPLGLSILALASAVQSVQAIQVDTAHPRILFHSRNIQEVRGRIFNEHADIWNDYYDNVSGRLGNENYNSYDADDYAVVYLITGETEFADAAIQIAYDMIEQPDDLSGEGGGPARTSIVACVYDWCYAHLTSAQRQHIYDALYPNVDEDPSYQQAWFIRDYNWGYMFAIANDGTAQQNAAVNANIEASIAQLEDFFLPCLDSLAPNSAIDGYSGIRIMTLLTFVDALANASDYEGPALDSPYYLNTGKFWAARFRPDQKWAKLPGKYNTSQSEPAGYFSYAGSRLGDPAAQAIADYLVAGDLGKPAAMLALAWHDPNAPSIPLSSVPRDYFDPDMGFVMTRDEWTLGNDSNAITVGFFNGADTVTNRTQNHFFITRGIDNLIIDSGRRYHDLANHFFPYFKRAVAHNTVLIYDPAEDFGSYENVWDDIIQIPNDGGQTDSNDDMGEDRWPECDGTYGYRGEITRYEATDGWVWVEGDASEVYSSSKAQQVLRRWVYLRPDWVIVQDRIVLNKPNLPVRAVYHMIDRPELDADDLSVLEGQLSTGGVFESQDARRVVVDRGDSSARIYWVEYEGGPSKMRLIGGANSQGEHWRQDFQPEDDDTYAPGDPSFEFWVDGRNYPPGYFVNQGNIDNRHSDNADSPGDWRVEFEVVGQTVVDMTALIHITSQGAPLADVGSTPLEDGISIDVRNGAEEFQISLCRPGVVCDGVGYDH